MIKTAPRFWSQQSTQ